MRFSLVYRALVRAQVEGMRGAPHSKDARRYLKIARARATPGRPRRYITHGLLGSGNTFGSHRLLENEGAIRVRSDIERKRLFGLEMHQSSRATGLQIHGAHATRRTYEYLLEMASISLPAGYPVVLDAALLARSETTQAWSLAGWLQVLLLF